MWRLVRPLALVATAAWLAAAGSTGVAALSQQAAPVGLPAAPEADLVRTRCLVCHGADLLTQQRLSRDGWGREVDKMIGWGAPLAEPERTAVVAYLARHFGGVVSTPDDEGEGLLTARCLACHDTRLIEQQRLPRAGWGRELEKMIGWGAVLTPQERDRLAAYLAERFGAPE